MHILNNDTLLLLLNISFQTMIIIDYGRESLLTLNQMASLHVTTLLPILLQTLMNNVLPLSHRMSC